MTVITVMPGSVAAYTVDLWNNTQSSGPRKDEKNSLMDGASCPISKPLSRLNSITEASAIPQHPIQMMTILPAVRGKRSLIVE